MSYRAGRCRRSPGETKLPDQRVKNFPRSATMRYFTEAERRREQKRESERVEGAKLLRDARQEAVKVAKVPGCVLV